MSNPIIDTVTPSYLSILVSFTHMMLEDDAYTDIVNYSITPNEVDAVTCEVISVTAVPYSGVPIDPPPYTSSSSVILEVTDMTKDKEYLITIASNTIQGRNSEGYVVAPNNTETFDATSELPIVQTIRSLTSYSMEVIFSKDMAFTDLDNTSNYSFDKGLRVLGVEVVSPRTVNLTTTKQTSSELYSLTVL